MGCRSLNKPSTSSVPGLNGGSREQQQTVARDVNGNPTVVSIDIRQSTKPAATTPAPAPTDNKQPK